MDSKFNWEKLADAFFEATVVFDRKSNNVVFINQQARMLFNLSEMALEELSLRYFCNRADLFNAAAAIRLFAKFQENDPQVIDWPVRLGSTQWLSAYINLFSDDGIDYVIVSFRDGTDQKKNLLELNKMVSFREMLDHLLSYNTMVAASKIPSLIDNSLAKVGHFFNCDRSYVFEYSRDKKLHSNINEWCAPGVEPYIDDLQNIPNRKFSYLTEHLFNKEIICLNDVGNLPDSATNEREEFAKEGIQSILIIPFVVGDEVIGFLGLDHVQTAKVWTEVEVSNLQLLARAFANMLLRLEQSGIIQEQRKMYRTWFLAANDSIGVFKNGICIDANPKLLSDLECSRNYLIGRSLVELSATVQPNGKSPTYINVYHKNAVKGKPQFFEWYLRKENGDDINVEISLNSYEENGQVHDIAIFRDVTENKEAVKNIISPRGTHKNNKLGEEDFTNQDLTLLQLFDLDQLQKLQDAFAKATGTTSLITDIDGTPITEISRINNICKLVKNHEEGQKLCMKNFMLLGQKAKGELEPFTQFCLSCDFYNAVSPIVVDNKHIGNWYIGQVKPESLSIDKLLEKTRKYGVADVDVISQYHTIKPMNQDQFDRILNLMNVLTNELSILGFNNLKLAQSLHEHVGLEKKLRIAKQNAEESDRLKSAFLANLSHEIRTPMNGIVGFSDLLLLDNLTPDDRREYVGLLNKSSRQLLNIINDIIDISKIESGQIEVHASFFDINSMFMTLYKLHESRTESKGIHLKCKNLDNDELEIYSDETKLSQVMSNLISNAIKFTSSGFVEFGYQIIQGGHLNVFVQDSGVGIDAESFDFIFDRFWQAKDDDVKKGGTGLGLAITKAYVELLGGHIKVESEVDEGTRFSFTIPKLLN